MNSQKIPGTFRCSGVDGSLPIPLSTLAGKLDITEGKYNANSRPPLRQQHLFLRPAILPIKLKEAPNTSTTGASGITATSSSAWNTATPNRAMKARSPSVKLTATPMRFEPDDSPRRCGRDAPVRGRKRLSRPGEQTEDGGLEELLHGVRKAAASRADTRSDNRASQADARSPQITAPRSRGIARSHPDGRDAIPAPPGRRQRPSPSHPGQVAPGR